MSQKVLQSLFSYLIHYKIPTLMELITSSIGQAYRSRMLRYLIRFLTNNNFNFGRNPLAKKLLFPPFRKSFLPQKLYVFAERQQNFIKHKRNML